MVQKPENPPFFGGFFQNSGRERAQIAKNLCKTTQISKTAGIWLINTGPSITKQTYEKHIKICNK